MKYVAIVLCTLLGACAAPLKTNQTRITISSNPPGATISNEDGSAAAQAPHTMTWTLAPGQTAIASAPIVARWVSGATATTRLNLIAGKTQTYTMNRPNLPGLDADIQWAIHLQGQSSNALAGALNSYLEGRYGNQSGSRAGDLIMSFPSDPVTCVSTSERPVAGRAGTVTTKCQ